MLLSRRARSLHKEGKNINDDLLKSKALTPDNDVKPVVGWMSARRQSNDCNRVSIRETASEYWQLYSMKSITSGLIVVVQFLWHRKHDGNGNFVINCGNVKRYTGNKHYELWTRCKVNVLEMTSNDFPLFSILS